MLKRTLVVLAAALAMSLGAIISTTIPVSARSNSNPQSNCAKVLANPEEHSSNDVALCRSRQH